MATIRKLQNGRFRADIRKNYTFIQAKTFSSKKAAEQWAFDFDAKLENILSLSPSEISNLTPDQVEKFGGRDVFSKLGIELDFLTFHELVDEYISTWNKKDVNQIPRAHYWQEVFKSKPIKAITSQDVRKALDHYAKGKVLKGFGPGKSVEINKHEFEYLDHLEFDPDIPGGWFVNAQQVAWFKSSADWLMNELCCNFIVRLYITFIHKMGCK